MFESCLLELHKKVEYCPSFHSFHIFFFSFFFSPLFLLLFHQAFENYEYEFEDVSKSIAKKLKGQLPNYTGVSSLIATHKQIKD